MKGSIKSKGIAAAITLAFIGLVRPDPNPSLVGVAFTALLMYEGFLYCIRYVGKINQRKLESKKIKVLLVNRHDIKRWANTWLYWPIHEEVS